jgi:glucose/arabinose dehydrogenase
VPHLRRLIAVLIGLLLVALSLGTVRALDQSAMPGGAPGPKAGPFQPKGFARVIDGDTFEANIDGRRAIIGVLGVEAAGGGTPCADAARSELRALIARGVTLQDDPSNLFDNRQRRLYLVHTADGRSVAAALVAAGLAKANGLGPEAATLAAADARARQDTAGCIWGGPLPAPRASGQMSVQAAANVLPNFGDEVVASNLNAPTGFAFLPDGRVLVSEKAGRVRLVTSTGVQPGNVLDISSRVNAYHDRGLIGITIDPNFASNGDFYLFYTLETAPGSPAGKKRAQVARFTLNGGTAIDTGPAGVILGKNVGAACPDPAPTVDCLPGDDISHAGGGLKFGADGYLYVSTGEAASFQLVDTLALRAQNLDSLGGKILRVTKDGKGISTNPFWNQNQNVDAVSAKVWAYGFRNPFRFALRPGGTTPLFVGDVGWSEWEEITAVRAGTNAGWPCYEGGQVQAGYEDYPTCESLASNPPALLHGPLIEWNHNGGGAAALGGTFYSGTAFPPTLQGAFFYGDYARGWIKSARIDANNVVVGSPQDFATGIGGLVQIESGPDGALWYLNYATSELRRIRYVGNYTPIQCPDGQWKADYYQNQDVFGTPLVQRCETSIDYNWGETDPVPGVTRDDYSVRWTGRFTFGNDTYEFKATSDDGARIFVDGVLVLDDWVPGAVNTVTANKVMTAGEHTIVAEYFDVCCPAEMRVSWRGLTPNNPPVPTISAPVVGTTFKVGDIIQLAGSATDSADGTITGTGLQWKVILKHCPGFGPDCHDHELVALSGTTGQFEVPNHGDGSYFEIRLTATDSGGLAATTTRQVDPKTLQVTVATAPTGGTITYDGVSHAAPHSATTIAGSTHTISVQPSAGQAFVNWLHGGAQQQNVAVGEQNVSYTANLSAACSPRPRVTLNSAVVSAGRLLVSVSSATTPGHPPNVIRSIQFDELTRASVEVPGKPVSTVPFAVPYPAAPSQADFLVQRTAPGAEMVRFTVTDDCGTWPTFIGTGTSGGW